MSEMDIIPNKIPKILWKSKNYDDIILFALAAFGSLEVKEFLNDPKNNIMNKINKTEFEKSIQKLHEQSFIKLISKDHKEYLEIMEEGENEIFNIIKKYPVIENTINIIENLLKEANLP